MGLMTRSCLKKMAVLIGVLTGLPAAQARWFVLPGLFYDDEFGLVGSLALIGENARKDRIMTTLAYFGNDEGEVGLFLFSPRQKVEWTFDGSYQVSEQKAYSEFQPSDQEQLYADTRYGTELLLRCDFPRKNGFFYGLEGAYRHHGFRYGYADALSINPSPYVAELYDEGEEYCASLRVGLERRDDRYHTRRGLYLLWQMDLGRTQSSRISGLLVRTQLDVRRYLPLLSDRSILALNFRGGVIHHQVPYISRFKMGGSFSLRGFPLDRYSGNGFYLIRTEFRQTVREKIPSPFRLLGKLHPEFKDHHFSGGFVVFTDCGDLWREDLGWWGLRQDIGVGLRAVFPPSVVASLDVATPVDSDHLAVYLNLEQSC